MIDLGAIPQLDAREVRMLWIDDYYDGALSGAMLFRGRIYWFELADATGDARRYVLHALSDEEIEEESRWHALFVEHVGDHWTMQEDGKARGSVRRGELHAKFYDAYAKRTPVDRARQPIIGWVEFL